jgi:transcriptional regulator with XRE-family HTH domain
MVHSSNQFKKVQKRAIRDNCIPSNDGMSTVVVNHLMESGERLREERERLGLTQAELGEIAAVAKNTQHNYEKGVRSPDAAYLAAVAAAGVDVLYVVTGQRTPRVEEGLSEREKAVLDNYRSLGEGDQAAVQRLTDALAQSGVGGSKAGS